MTDLTVPGLGQQISDLVSNDLERDQQQRDWLAGVVGGGPTGNGNYPLTDRMGVTRMVPCPAQQVYVTQKGAPAKTDMGFFFQGPLGANETLAVYNVSGSLSFSQQASYARARAGPAAPRDISVYATSADGNTRTLYATIHFDPPPEPGPVTGVITFSSSTTLGGVTTSNALTQGMMLEVVAPVGHDATLADVSITFAGV